ncbi:paired amphipathic helix protein Sin3-like 4-like [Dorcoceras hygrometricum]|uniref:Paired amphipathic helix protein Sin3-like 4-like n=1 Tax=Dorcoceras hygrometricum TaxID=472368 RepID=A0A2Z7CBR0_9LAMI|nr:paired amphipathic helix protein Sin3-like 4-like [Dorcoceras hygrometricum]
MPSAVAYQTISMIRPATTNYTVIKFQYYSFCKKNFPNISGHEFEPSSLFKKKKKRRWSWNEEVQQEATVGFQQMRRGARYGMSCEALMSSQSADEAKRERLCDVVCGCKLPADSCDWMTSPMTSSTSNPSAESQHDVASALALRFIC